MKGQKGRGQNIRTCEVGVVFGFGACNCFKLHLSVYIYMQYRYGGECALMNRISLSTPFTSALVLFIIKSDVSVSDALFFARLTCCYPFGLGVKV